MTVHCPRIISILVVSFAFSFAPPTIACSCFGDNNSKKELRQCDAVFTGRPLRHRIVTVDDVRYGDDARRRMRELTFEVDGVWKGALSRRATVLTAMTSAECGYNFDLRVPYVVYARQSQGRLHTTSCDLTKPLRAAQADLKALGSPKALK